MSENGEPYSNQPVDCDACRLHHETCFRALTARDARFDGLFFVGVSTTGIYCRPICPARTPGKDRCSFYSCAAAAEIDGYRPCLRCRPELAPGFAPIDSGRRIAHAAAQRIEAGALNHDGTVHELADEFAMSARQLRRIIQREFGVTPVQLAQTNRLLLAKQLLAETNIPMIDVAWSSGFDSVRRFNTAIKTRYGFTPSEMRRLRKDKANDDHIELAIGYRPPYAWCELIGFLQPRLTQGVEAIVAGSYVRSVQINKCRGWFRVSQNPDKHILKLMVSIDLLPVMSSLLSQVRRMFDVSARPDVISDHLAQDKQLAALVRQHPGLRVPGTVNGLELIIRAILGQQITVKAATTLTGRLATEFGRPVKTPFDEINRLSPAAKRLAKAAPKELVALGILESRANTILAIARRFSQRELMHQSPGSPTH